MAHTLTKRKRIALVAHDHKKMDLLEWAKFNRETLAGHGLFATGTTGTLLEKELDLDIVKLQSGPLGGDQQIGAMIFARGAGPLGVLLGTLSSPNLTTPTSKPFCA